MKKVEVEDGEGNGIGNKTGEKTENRIAKITGTVEMEQALDRMVQGVNDGFAGGRVTRHDLVSWAVLYFERECFRDCVEQLRQDHFDQLAYLEAVLKQAKQVRREGGSPADILALLGPLSGTAKTAASRRTKKPGQLDLLGD